MRSHRNIWVEAILWVIAEIILNSSGLDLLADYNEFLTNQKTMAMTQAMPVRSGPQITGQAIEGYCLYSSSHWYEVRGVEMEPTGA